ncbi:MAG: acyltransferase, partial [Lachnospiraceae bacterium]|nr:acyltransferase [Lachnospiraceae bacterium]
VVLNIIRCMALLLIIYDHLWGMRMSEFYLVTLIDKLFMIPFNVIQWGGALGVSLFFIISGYLLVMGIDRKGYDIKCLPSKIISLYVPCMISYATFYVFQGIVAISEYGRYFKQFSAKDWLLGGTLLAYFTPRGDVVNGTTWYLVATFFAYTYILLFAGLIKKTPGKGIAATQIFIGILMCLPRSLSNEGIFKSLFSYNWYVYIVIYGVIIYCIQHKKLRLNEAVFVSGLNYILLLVGVYMYAPQYASSESSYLISIAYAVLIVIAGLCIEAIYGLKQSKLAAQVSDISFYVYLVHMTYGGLLLSLLTPYFPCVPVSMITMFIIVLIAYFHKKICKWIGVRRKRV